MILIIISAVIFISFYAGYIFRADIEDIKNKKSSNVKSIKQKYPYHFS